ncbi:hypothetical protein ElyMa_005074800 [Elysia marginata]|uniref:Syndecan/Neurexin domain-containing protein n=1 Tax=Elysia marginata TaxID=1093978 RepID=A0AAV4JKP8_9GAST|nr:hypothetical protein ElyMa_005074800 [Elysia marginata]
MVIFEIIPAKNSVTKPLNVGFTDIKIKVFPEDGEEPLSTESPKAKSTATTDTVTGGGDGSTAKGNDGTTTGGWDGSTAKGKDDTTDGGDKTATTDEDEDNADTKGTTEKKTSETEGNEGKKAETETETEDTKEKEAGNGNTDKKKGGGGGSGSNTGVIVGSIFGVLIGLALIGAAVWWFYFRSNAGEHGRYVEKLENGSSQSEPRSYQNVTYTP